jgi:DNA replication and repair protein RecF
MSVVAFSPDELIMVGGNPEQRRRYLDRAIFSSNAGYLKVYHDYFRVLRQRNQLLRQRNYLGIEAWTEQLVSTATRLIVQRNDYLGKLAKLLTNLYRSISGSDEEARLCYHANSLPEVTEEPFIAQNLWQKISENSRNERERGMTMIGPHRDDLGFYLNGKPIRQHGSQGQQKSFVLALKMAEIEFMRAKDGRAPILLLDDMAAELDHNRISHLLSFLLEREMQVFITTTDPAIVPLSDTTICSVFPVTGGRLGQ